MKENNIEKNINKKTFRLKTNSIHSEVEKISKENKNRLKVIKNKILIKEYPFLLPRNVFTNKVIKDYDYTFTNFDSIPIGWRKTFGIYLCEDLKNALLKQKNGEQLLKDYRVHEIKEKYGSLRWYDSFCTNETMKVLYKYEYLSEHICIHCGKVDVKMYDFGWISPYCDDCMDKILEKRKSTKTREDFVYNDSPLEEFFILKSYSKETGDTRETIFIADILERLQG